MEGTQEIARGTRLELGCLHGGEVLYQPGDALEPRVLQDFELVYIIEGSASYAQGGQLHTIEPGGFILSQPGTAETYTWDAEHCTRHAYVHFDITHYPSDWPDPSEWPRIRNQAGPLCARLFRRILQRFYETCANPHVAPSPEVCRLIAVLMDILFEGQATETTSFERERPEPVRRALMHIRRMTEENPHYPLSLRELAATAHVTEKHLCRLFAKWVGHSPIQTYTLVRLESAVALLTRTNLTVKEVAQRCGFDNALYFSRLFSKTYGLSPSSFRKELKTGAVRSRTLLPVDLLPRIR